MSAPSPGDPFADIRPYRDEEVPGVIAALVRDPEFADVLLRMRLPLLARCWPGCGRWLLRLVLRRRFRGIHTVADFQALIGNQLRPHMQRVASSLTVSGLEGLERGRGYLFIGNHRDIAMDPALVNLMLHDHGYDTVLIAIGDNLLSKRFASDLMRINRSFIVKRGVTGRREKLAAFQQLSGFIRHSVVDERCSVWIAQREGRAKDGVDVTDTAILKMLALSRGSGQDFATALAALHPVPVTISYEFDPCDRDKAHELHALRTVGEYRKAEHEDLQSIYRGIMGDKGRVHVAFGTPLAGADLASDQTLARAIDRAILRDYRLCATHFLAHELLHGPDPRAEKLRATLVEADWPASEQRFRERLAAVPAAERDIFLAMYANPLRRRLDLES
ncbi:MAG TPA: 1-acyl-sn-glycerol-3-phosphate acyltransferase [Porticoccaceae bacterium]|nr:1-acyl-sn-glycerol-3-phosphate acyltransferase [Porticoccaceae bacterium]